MAAELVNAATNEKLTEIDWTKNIEICELVARDPRHTKDVIKAIKKRLGSKNGNTQLLAASLLETLMNNIGEPIHKQVIDNRIIPILVKIVKAKSELPVREKIFLLLDAAQTSVGGASGKFPKYYTAYYELVTAGVKFPQRAVQTSSNGVHSSPPAKEQIPVQPEKIATEVEGPHPSDPRILEKAGTALEILREVLAAIDSRHPEAAKDEFTLDLVEQCSFHKQKVMQLAMNSRDDKVVSQAIDLNEQLQKVLRKHDALVSIEPTSVANHLPRDEEGHEEEEPEQLFRRLRKGKAHVRPEDEEHPADRSFGLLSSPVLSEIPHRPLIRPLTVEPKKEVVRPLTVEPKKEVVRPLTVEPKKEVVRPLTVEPKKEVVRPLPAEKKQEDVRPFSVEPSPEPVGKAVVSIPPPPAKHVERERFFQQKKTDGSSVSGHMRGLSLHSRNASSSGSGSADFSSETFL